MAYERYPRGDDPQRGSYGRDDMSDYGQDFGSTEDRYTYSSARDYRSAGAFGRGDDDRGGYQQQRGGGRERGWGGDRDGGRQERFTGGSDYYRGDQDGGYGRNSYGQGRDNDGQSGYGQGGYGQNSYGRGRQDFGSRDYGRDTYPQTRGNAGRQPQRYRDEGNTDRGFMARAGDEVRSWFGDEEAERRREMDARRDEQAARGSYGRDEHYHSWRNQQLQQFDRDYDEYRRENQTKFHNEFSSWRTERQGQRDLLGQVQEHAEVVGSDGEHIGTVDKVRGDRIILTKNDSDAGGRHHSIPSRWLQSADGNKVTLRKTAAEAKAHWRDEERQDSDRGALFGDQRAGDDDRQPGAGGNLNRSFTGTY